MSADMSSKQRHPGHCQTVVPGSFSPVPIVRLQTGVRGLDEVLGGGIPELSCTVIAGGSGTGKTTLAHQIMFAHVAQGRPALYFTALGEPALHVLRYQQQFSFFDPDRIGSAVHYVDLSEKIMAGDLDTVLKAITNELDTHRPALVAIDSIRAVLRGVGRHHPSDDAARQDFLRRLVIHFALCQTTALLVGEYEMSETTADPLFAMTDAIVWLHRAVEATTPIRTCEVLKVRGQRPLGGVHLVRLSTDGVHIVARRSSAAPQAERPPASERMSSGNRVLDEMLGGGVPAGDSVLIAGASGTGKSVLTARFIAEGGYRGQPGVIAVFGEHPRAYLARATALQVGLEELVKAGLVEIIQARPLDLSPDEILLRLQRSAHRLNARRVAIDSLSGFEASLTPDFRAELYPAVSRMVGAMTATGVTVWLTEEVPPPPVLGRFGHVTTPLETDDLIRLRHVEVDGRLRKLLTVVKMRGSVHSDELRLFDVAPGGVRVDPIS